MAVRVGKAYVEIEGDFSGLDDGIKKATSGTRDKFRAIGKAAAAGIAVGVGAFAALGKASIDAASDIDESLSKNEKLFGASAKTVERFAQTSAKSYGISRKSVLEYTGVFGNLFRALGQSEKASATQSVALTKLAADMASFNNTSVEEALDAIRSGLVGETEPLRRFGVNMNDATLKAQALKMGLISTTKDALSPQNKALAASALITKQTAQAHGDFERTSGGLANQQKILKARWEDAQATLGAKLLPIALKVVTALSDMMTAAQRGTGVFGTLRGVVDAVAPVIDRIRGAFSGAGESGDRMAAVTNNLRGAMETLRTVWVAVVDIAGALWRRFGEDVIEIAKDALDIVNGLAQGVQKTLRGLVDFLAGVFTGDWRRAWDGIKGVVSGIWKLIVSVIDGAWESIKGIVRLGMSALTGIIKGFAGALTSLGRWIVNQIAEGIKTLTQALASVGGWIKNRVVDGIEAAVAGFRSVGGWIVNRIADGLMAVTGFAERAGGWVKNRVVDGVQAYIEGVKGVGSWIVNRIWDGLVAVSEFESRVGGWIKNRVVDGIHALKSAFSGVGGWIVDKIGDGLKGGANAIIGFINAIIGAINKIPGVEIGKIKGLRMGGTVEAGDLPGFARGGAIHHDAFAKGGEITRPMVVVGEEAPKHPEYVIPTNPAYRTRALGLHAQLSRQLGVPGFALGGVLGDLPGVGDLPGWLKGTGTWVLDKAKDWIKKQLDSVIGDGGAGIKNLAGGLTKSLQQAMQAAVAMGLQITSTTGGRHAPNSWHYRGRAFDASNGFGPTPQMMRFAKFMEATAGKRLLELFYTPLGYSIKNGQRVAPIAAGGHNNHVHVAMRKGGILGGPFVGSYRTGGIVPQDGFAYVHKGEGITPAERMGGVDVHVHFDDPTLRDLIRVEVRDRDRATGGAYLAGVRA